MQDKILDKYLISHFNHAKESVSSKNIARLLNKTVSKKEKREFSEKLISKRK